MHAMWVNRLTSFDPNKNVNINKICSDEGIGMADCMPGGAVRHCGCSI